jgi:hypothetical protein
MEFDDRNGGWWVDGEETKLGQEVYLKSKVSTEPEDAS